MLKKGTLLENLPARVIRHADEVALVAQIDAERVGGDVKRKRGRPQINKPLRFVKVPVSNSTACAFLGDRAVVKGSSLAMPLSDRQSLLP